MTGCRMRKLVGLLLLLATCTLALVEAGCFRTKEPPDGASLWTPALTSATRHVLADVVGYVRLFEEGHVRHVPLQFNQLDDLFASTHDGFNNHKLTLAGECVVLGLNYSRAGSSVVYHQLEMFINQDSYGGRPDWRQSCDFSPRFAFVHAKERHFSCLEQRGHPCFRDGAPVAELVLRRFKFETHVAEVARGQRDTFDKPPLEESCAYW